jgi:hypothetical protein
MRRFLGAVLVGLGTLLIVLAVGMPTFLEPQVSQLPTNLKPCNVGSTTEPAGCLPPVTARAVQAAYLQTYDDGSAKVNSGDLIDTVEVKPQPNMTVSEQNAKRIPDTAEIWAVYATVKDAQGVVIQQTTVLIALDRKTGAAVNWANQYLADGTDQPVTFKGNEFQFPFNTEKKDYAVFDENIKTTVTAKFKAEEDINGLNTYHFQSQVPDTPLDLPQNDLDALGNTFAGGQGGMQVIYSDTKDVWIEPTTGVIIKVRDQQHKVLEDANGKSIQVLLDGDFITEDASVKAAVDSAKSNTSQLKLLGIYLPVTLGIVGLVLLIVGFLLLRSGGSTAADPGNWDETLPEPRHRLKGDEAAAPEPAEQSPWPRN